MKTPAYDLSSQSFTNNPFPTLARMREAAPLIHMDFPRLGDAWVATTYESVQKVLRDQDAFVMDPRNAGKKYLPGMSWWVPRAVRNFTKHMLNRDGADHRRLRNLVEQAFRRHSVEGMRDRLETLAADLIDKMAAQADAEGQVDLLVEFARPYPLTVICEVLGLPLADRPKFIRWAERLLSAESPLKLLRAVPTFLRMRRYFLKQFRLCRAQPREGLISALVQAEESGDRLSEDELVAMAFLLLIAGHETTVHLITSTLIALLERPDQKQQLMSDWSQAESAVDESLRFNTPVLFAKARYASRDLEFCGQRLKKGDYIVPCLASANRDEAEFPHGEQFDITRSASRHLALGGGVHYCLGAKLTRVEAAIAIQALLTRFPGLELAISAEEIPYGTSVGVIRGVRSLPVKLHEPGHVPTTPIAGAPGAKHSARKIDSLAC